MICFCLFAKLRADNTTVPVGGSVTLTCSVNPSSSSGWKYYWYRDEKSSEALTTQDAVFQSNGQISVSQEGLYRCRGGRGNPVYYTEDSQSVRIGKTGQFNMKSDKLLIKEEDEEQKALIFLTFIGETITVRCEIHGGDTEWDYEWETNSRIKAPNQNEYRIRSASSSNSGNYRCKGRMKSSHHSSFNLEIETVCKNVFLLVHVVIFGRIKQEMTDTETWTKTHETVDKSWKDKEQSENTQGDKQPLIN
uniref:Ig-like domain-containing protein n=1 Tax=Maylandia zebra TaxID=106582 RepID=A0A3P9D0D7_9CICH